MVDKVSGVAPSLYLQLILSQRDAQTWTHMPKLQESMAWWSYDTEMTESPTKSMYPLITIVLPVYPDLCTCCSIHWKHRHYWLSPPVLHLTASHSSVLSVDVLPPGHSLLPASWDSVPLPGAPGALCVHPLSLLHCDFILLPVVPCPLWGLQPWLSFQYCPLGSRGLKPFWKNVGGKIPENPGLVK